MNERGLVLPGQIELEAEVTLATPQGVVWVAVCIAEPPELQHVDCMGDIGDEFGVFVPIGGSIYQEVHAAFFIPTPEPSTGGLLFVAACFLCAFVALRRRMA